MSERKIPALMRPHVSVKPDTASTKEVARVENLNADVCPICKATMVLRVASGHSVKACLTHNIVMPVQD